MSERTTELGLELMECQFKQPEKILRFTGEAPDVIGFFQAWVAITPKAALNSLCRSHGVVMEVLEQEKDE